MKSWGLNPTVVEIQEIMKEVDDSGDGELDFAEFLEIMSRMMQVMFLWSVSLACEELDCFYCITVSLPLNTSVNFSSSFSLQLQNADQDKELHEMTYFEVCKKRTQFPKTRVNFRLS